MTTTTPTPAAGPIAYVDVETDGLHTGRQAWEIAIIRHGAAGDGALREEVFHAFIRVSLRPTSDPYALNVGRFYDRHPFGRELTGKSPNPDDVLLLSPRAAALRVHQLLAGATIVGVNPRFDVETLGTLLRAEGLPDQPWDYHLEDLISETVGHLRARWATGSFLPEALGTVGDPAWAPFQTALDTYDAAITRPWKSHQLSAALGVEPPPEHLRHTALADAEWACRWHTALRVPTAPVGAVTQP